MANVSFLTVKEAAAELRTSVSTIRRAVDAGDLDAVRVSPRVTRIPAESWERFIGKSASDGVGMPETSTATKGRRAG